MAVKIDALLEVLLYTTTDKGLLYCGNLCNAKLNFRQCFFFLFFQFECDKVGYSIYGKLNFINAKYFSLLIEMPIIARKEKKKLKLGTITICTLGKISWPKHESEITKFCYNICDFS